MRSLDTEHRFRAGRWIRNSPREAWGTSPPALICLTVAKLTKSLRNSVARVSEVARRFRLIVAWLVPRLIERTVTWLDVLLAQDVALAAVPLAAQSVTGLSLPWD